MSLKLFKINKILLHDNDEDEAYFFEHALKSFPEPIELLCSYNFDQLEKNLEHRPDVIFMDINIPEKNGFECLRMVRSRAELNKTPVIMYSSTSRHKEVQDAYRQGANLFINKPTMIKNVEDCLRTVLAIDWSDIDNITGRHAAKQLVLHFEG